MSAALLLIVVFMCCLSLSGGIAGGLYFLGEECSGDDKNGVYERKWDGTCVLKSCKTGWTKSGETCVSKKDSGGTGTGGTGTPPPPPPPPPPAVDCLSFGRNEDACVNAGCSWDFSGCSV